MDHTEAVRLMAAERYLLDDLTSELQEGFEEHYFECQECALDVRAGNAFIGYAKLELAAKPEAKAVADVVKTKSRGWANVLSEFRYCSAAQEWNRSSPRAPAFGSALFNRGAGPRARRRACGDDQTKSAGTVVVRHTGRQPFRFLCV